MISIATFFSDHGRKTESKKSSTSLLLIRFGLKRSTVTLLAFLLLIVMKGGEVEAGTVVGRMAGDFSVGATGGAAYRIPITVAAGQNGVKPEIALLYNSEREDGMAGVGWTIAGLSKITRCGLTPALDGEFQGVHFSPEDRYCLDGQPLIQVSTGNYWSGGQEYRAEIHNYEKIMSFGSVGTGSGAGPRYFEVRHRNGLIYRYGFNADSQVQGVANYEGAIRLWALDEIRDAYNTRVFFSYEEDETTGEFLPATIKWSARSGETENDARYRLTFQYEDRAVEAVRTGYTWGSLWTRSKRLRYIDYDFNASAGFARVHRYILSYQVPANGTGRSVLGSVQQCGPDDCFSPTTFSSHVNVRGWEPDATPVKYITYSFDDAKPGDFNGDGRQDLFVPQPDGWAVLPGTRDSASGRSDLDNVVSTGMSAATPASTRLMDYNGDGLSDLLTPDAVGNNWHVYQSNGITLSDIDIHVSKAEFTDPIVLDINGDGLDDILYSISNSTMHVRINNGNGFDAPVVATNELNGIGPDLTYRGGTPDFDGDGRDDYFEQKICYGEGCRVGYFVRIYLSNGSGFDYAGEFSLAAGSGQETVSQFNQPSLRAIDANGDGLSDLMYLASTAVSGWTWYTMISHGDGFDAAINTGISYPVGNPNLGAGGTPYTTADYDMDGRDDLVVGITGSGGGWTVYPSNGTTFSSVGIPLTGVTLPGSNTVFAIDVGGTGYPALVYKEYQWSRLALLGHAGETGVSARPDVLVSVTDGMGNYYKIDWKPMGQVAGYSGGADYPNERELHAGNYVVNNFVSNDGTASGDYTISYLYTDPRQDMRGRGFLGFKTVKSTDSRNNVYSLSTYRQEFPYVGRVDQVVRYQSDGKAISGYDPAWDTYPVTTGNGTHHFVHLLQSPGISSVVTEYEVDPSADSNGLLIRTTKRKVQYDFDQGAIRKDWTTVSSPIHSAAFTTLIDTAFEVFTGEAYCLGFPKKIDVTKSDSVEPAKTRTVQYSYNSLCQRVSAITGPVDDASQQLVMSYEIDSDGKLNSVTRGPGDGLVAERKISIDWDSIGAYRPLSRTAEITGETNLTVQQTWDYGLGIETSHTDPRGQSTVWQYDDFGRLELESRPGSASTTLTLTRCTGNCFPGLAQYKVHSERPDGYWSESFHDSYGRVVGVAKVVLADTGTTETRMSVGYDSLGRVAWRDVPYLLNENNFRISYSYDLRDRVRLENRPFWNPSDWEAKTSWVYDRLKVTKRDAEGNLAAYLYDAAGRLIETQAALGSGTQNSYWPFGELKSISQSGSYIKSLTYDARGFPRTMTDVDSGTWKYDYSVFGELISQVDDVAPTPNTITLDYDQLGRPRQRVEAEGVTKWTYHQSGNGLGLLSEVTGPLPSWNQRAGSCADNLGYCEQYTYDSMGRVRQTEHKFSGATNVTNFEYNDNNQITSMTYPAMLFQNRYKFIYTYDSGHLNTISKDMGGGSSQIIYDVVRQDAFENNELAKIFGIFGSGKTEFDLQRHYFATSGLIQSIKTGAAPQGTNVQNYEYTWDEVGNLILRRDLNQAGLTEQFAYDGLNRLTDVSLDGITTRNIEYLANGNIDSSSTVGTYSYAGAGGSRSVTSVTNGPRPNTYHYDANGNMDCRGDSSATCAGGDSIDWTSFNKPARVNYGSDIATFDYGPNRHRVMQHTTGTVSRETRYVGSHFERYTESGNKQNWRANIFANGKVVYQLIEHKRTGACTSQQGSQGYFVLRDHQNSVDVLLNNGTSNDSRYSFDAFGKRRNVIGWTADTDDVLMNINHTGNRGYTGHEHLDKVRLIHMNGRVQDPILGRMISPDPIPGSLLNPQSLNSYSYVMNNPLSLADPSGFQTECGRTPGPACESGVIDGIDVPIPDGPVDEIITFPVGVPVPPTIRKPVFSGSGDKALSGRIRRIQSRILDNLTVTVPRGEGLRSRFSSINDLGSVLSPGDGIFGKRPLDSGFFSGVPVDGFEAPIGDFLNIELLHEQFFFRDKNGVIRDFGFFKSESGGVIGPDPGFPGNITLYKFGTVYLDIDLDSLDLAPTGFEPGTYDFNNHNCQDYCDAIRDQF